MMLLSQTSVQAAVHVARLSAVGRKTDRKGGGPFVACRRAPDLVHGRQGGYGASVTPDAYPLC